MKKSEDIKVIKKTVDTRVYSLCLNCGYLDKTELKKCPDCDSQAVERIESMRRVLLLKEQIRGILWS